MQPKYCIQLTLVLTLGLMLVILPEVCYARGGNDPPSRSDQDPEIKKKKLPGVIRSEAGLNIPELGVSIDSFYDERLDNLIKGYKILNIVVTNRGGQDIYLDVAQDHWKIVDSFDKRHSAYNHIRSFDAKLWEKLPTDFKKKVDYPQIVRPGKSTTVDVFFPESVSLMNIREIVWKSKHFGKEFNVFTNYEKILDVRNDDKEFDNPASNTTKWDKKGDLKTREDVLNPSHGATTDTAKATSTGTETTTGKSRFYPTFEDAIEISPSPMPSPHDEDSVPAEN